MSTISFSSKQDAIKKIFGHHTGLMKMGVVMAMTGNTMQKCGCGKSVTAIKIGELLDKDFNVDKVAFSPREFLSGLDKIEENKAQHSGKPKIGQVVVMDEGEITASSNTWFSFTNKAIFYALTTCRYLRGMAIIVTPSFKWIDYRMRTLMNYWGSTTKYIKDGKPKVMLKLYEIHTDMMGEDLYFRKPILYDLKNKRYTKMSKFDVNLPSKELLDAYEKKSLKFKKDLRTDLVKEIIKFETQTGAKDPEKKLKLDDVANTILKDESIMKFIVDKNRISRTFLQHKCDEKGLDLTTRQVSSLGKIIEIKWNGKKV